MNRVLLSAAVILGLAACSRQPSAETPAARGERYFAGLGCVKCHQIGGQGHAWGPDLTMVGFRKSPEWIDQWLKNPHAWNQRTIMPNFNLPEQTRADLVAYLSEQKGQAWKELPWRTEQAKALPAIERGKVVFNNAGCVTCHGFNGGGGYPNNNVAGGLIPTLTMVSEGYTKKELHDKIRLGAVPIPTDMSKPAPMLQMPKWGEQLKADEIDAVVEYLFSLKPKAAGGKASADDF